LRAGVLCSPLMPGITDARRSIDAVARAAKGADAKFFSSGPLFLKACSLPTFFQFVAENFPEQLAAYKRRYEGSAFVSAEYRRRVGDLVQSICREHKLGSRYEGEAGPGSRPIEPPVLLESQPWLPFA
jgi:DNA repair photolyase